MVKRVFPIVTVANIEQMPDDHGLTRYEVIEGELHIADEPHIKRQAVITTLCVLFGETLEASPLGLAFPAPPVVINSRDGVARNFSYLIPDFAYVSNERFGEVTDGERFTAAPDLVIEVVLTGDEYSSANRRIKRDIFRELGVPEYWIVSLEEPSISMFNQPRLKTDFVMREFVGDDPVTSSILPALRFTARELFTSNA